MAKKEQTNTRGVDNPGSVIKNPRITEKSTKASEQGVYTFDVGMRATKPEIVKAIGMLYKVKPLKVRIVNSKPKVVFVRGKWGTRGGGKKAYVYLNKGETIDIA